MIIPQSSIMFLDFVVLCVCRTVNETSECRHFTLERNVLPKHRDAPEPTGEEGEDADMELPKVYEPVPDGNELKERMEMFLSQFNEMVRGAGMDLVFFPDAMLHLVKVRINYTFLFICYCNNSFLIT